LERDYAMTPALIQFDHFNYGDYVIGPVHPDISRTPSCWDRSQKTAIPKLK